MSKEQSAEEEKSDTDSGLSLSSDESDEIESEQEEEKSDTDSGLSLSSDESDGMESEQEEEIPQEDGYGGGVVQLLGGIGSSGEFYEYTHVAQLLNKILLPQLRLLKDEKGKTVYTNPQAAVITSENVMMKEMERFQSESKTNQPINPYIMLRLSGAGDVSGGSVGHWTSIILYKHENKTYVMSFDSLSNKDNPYGHQLDQETKEIIQAMIQSTDSTDEVEFITPNTHPNVCHYYRQQDGTSCGAFALYNTFMNLGLYQYRDDANPEYLEHLNQEVRFNHAHILSKLMAPEEIFEGDGAGQNNQLAMQRNLINQETAEYNNFFNECIIARINDGTYENPVVTKPQSTIPADTASVENPAENSNQPKEPTDKPKKKELSIFQKAGRNILTFLYFVCAVIVYAFTFGYVDWSKDESTTKTKPKQAEKPQTTKSEQPEKVKSTAIPVQEKKLYTKQIKQERKKVVTSKGNLNL